jgi:hypothetical protein
MMKESSIVVFSILTNLSSTQLTGYVEFAALISVDMHYYQSIMEKIYEEMEEYLFYIPNSYQKDFVFAVFFCANISTVNSIIRRLESYDGVKEVKDFIGTGRVYYQDWLKREVDKRITQKNLLLSSSQMTL